jgi:hypothetical protein
MKKVRVLTRATAVVPVAAAATMAGTAFPAAAAIIRPDTTIEQGACTNGTKNWVHMDTTHHGSRCFGFAGTADPDYYTQKVCPGNNRINVEWQSPTGDYWGVNLSPGYGWYTLSSQDYVYRLTIFSWSGNATC